MPQSEGETGIKNDTASNIRSGRMTPHLTHHTGVERNHGLLIDGFVGQQPPILYRCQKWSQMTAFGKLPMAIDLRPGLYLLLEHLFSRFTQQFGYSQMKLTRQTFDLVLGSR
jgi:hypothetical protein